MADGLNCGQSQGSKALSSEVLCCPPGHYSKVTQCKEEGVWAYVVAVCKTLAVTEARVDNLLIFFLCKDYPNRII